MAKPLVSDELWEVIRPLLPPPKPRRPDHPGRKPLGDRPALTGILFVLKTGLPWEDLPQEMGCGCGMTCWRRLQDWQHAGVWPRLHEVLLAKLHAADKIDWSRAAIDSSSARGAGEGSGPSPTDRGRPGVKHHVLTDAGGVPLQTDITAANVPDVKELVPLVDSVPPVRGKPGRPRRRPEAVYADRAYDSEPHRRQLRDRGVAPKLARRNAAHGSGLGVFRWVAERRCPGCTASASCGWSPRRGSKCNMPSWTWRPRSFVGVCYRPHKVHFVRFSNARFVHMEPGHAPCLRRRLLVPIRKNSGRRWHWGTTPRREQRQCVCADFGKC
jgi:transposase